MSSLPIIPAENILSITALAQALKVVVENHFEKIHIRGEISNAKLHSSGHLYLALKDAGAVLDAVCWRGVVAQIGFVPQDGMDVICRGRLTTYPGRSKYQIIIEKMELAGEGALLKVLEERKRKLAAEGLFDTARKKPLPFLPKCIGIITSPTGAVIRDMLHRLQDRFPRSILLWPVAVQGDGAAAQIADAIDGFNALPEHGTILKPDLLIVARGGGSLEDLWAFNEEIVVRAAARSMIPLISGVGHEPDVTLIDFAADHRAPTPSAAAERAVPVRHDIQQNLNHYALRLGRNLMRGLETFTLQLDERSERLHASIQRYFEHKMQNLQLLQCRLHTPTEALTQINLQLTSLSQRLQCAAGLYFQRLSQKVVQNQQLLQSYSYEKTLRRGFALVKSKDQNVISSVRQCAPGATVDLIFADGRSEATIKSDVPYKKKAVKKSSPYPQANLWKS